MVKYVASNGDECILDGPGNIKCARGHSLDWEFAIKELNGHVAYTLLDPAEFPLDVVIFGPDRATEMDHLADVIVNDASTGSFGKLYVDDWYRVCVPFSLEHQFFEDDNAFAVSIGFRADDPAWIRTEEQELISVPPEGLDFPHDFPHDLGVPAQTNSIRNRSSMACPVRIRVTGPATGWSVRIGTNVYKCSVNLVSGEMATIDGSTETITITRADGTSEDAFYSWQGTFKEGSGSYIFEPVPPGESPVSWEGCSGVAVTVYERRPELRWSA